MSRYKQYVWICEFTIFHFWHKKIIFSSYFLKVHVLNQEVGPKGTKDPKLK